MNAYEKVTFTGFIIEEREKSFLIEFDDSEKWFPKSQLVDNEDGSFTIPQWLADKIGVEE